LGDAGGFGLKAENGDMRRSYWIYSAGVAVVWAAILGINFAVHGDKVVWLFYIFVGFAIAWVSGTIARYVYPPPKRWQSESAH
jgi:hypothetical protein